MRSPCNHRLIDSIQQQALELTAKIDSNRQKISDLLAKCNGDCDQIMSDFHDAAAKAAHDPNGAYEIAVAKENARKKIADAHTTCDAATAPLQADADAATAQVNALRKQAADLIASVSGGQ